LRRLPGYGVVAGVAPKSMKKSYRRFVQKRIGPIEAEISNELQNRLEAKLKGDVRRLRSYLQTDFDGWGIA
jgi:hypothetical protein